MSTCVAVGSSALNTSSSISKNSSPPLAAMRPVPPASQPWISVRVQTALFLKNAGSSRARFATRLIRKKKEGRYGWGTRGRLNHRSCCIYLYQPPQTTTVVRHHHAHDLQQMPLTKSSHRSQLDLARNPGPVRRSPFSLSARSATHNVGRSQRDRAGIPRGARRLRRLHGADLVVVGYCIAAAARW